ncbi:aldehyde dehydrogenase family protein [Candidatus Parcubacteria bacterium]|nr:MAG: aldehyde dehydrogenase family protein [Candidatus Parcubacteria bacterium]
MTTPNPSPVTDWPATLKWVKSKLDIEDTTVHFQKCSCGCPNSDQQTKYITIISPINGKTVGTIKPTCLNCYEKIIQRIQKAFLVWRKIPAPKRGELILDFSRRLEELKRPLAMLITMEMGKIINESLGEVQEMIDICRFAVGLSRNLGGIIIPSERYRHTLRESWHPLGPVGIITAFNFPAAVWAWNAALALVCGDVCLWKPSSATPLTALACHRLLQKTLQDHNLPTDVSQLVIGRGSQVGNWMLKDERLPLISYTGSCKTGRRVAHVVAKRFGKTILELGGNNAVIVTPHADLELAAQNIFFGAIGTAGQRCTTTRRVIVHQSITEKLQIALFRYYTKLKAYHRIGNPLDSKILMGPLANQRAVILFQEKMEEAKQQGGKLIWPGYILTGEKFASGCYVSPAIAEMPAESPIVKEENFIPLLYFITYQGDITEAITINNDVPQGLSSAIFTNDLKEAELFLSAEGSDCGLANVNASTSGAEIGLAFGGEKWTGGGRESGSDAWKQYMRRLSSAINWSGRTELAQNITFE